MNLGKVIESLNDWCSTQKMGIFSGTDSCRLERSFKETSKKRRIDQEAARQALERGLKVGLD